MTKPIAIINKAYPNYSIYKYEKLFYFSEGNPQDEVWLKEFHVQYKNQLLDSFHSIKEAYQYIEKDMRINKRVGPKRVSKYE